MTTQNVSETQHWKAGLCDPGEGGDCPRACFIGCDQFGRTQYRLQHLESDEAPNAFSKYDGCNKDCWVYALLCIGTHSIGSGVYTGKQTRKIRETYGIKGDYADDVVKGIFCQPCSLIRNSLEIRRRQNEKIHLGLFQAPVPLGESQYEPIYAMGSNVAYAPEPRMSMTYLRPDNEGQGPRMVPLYPEGPELPQIPQIATPIQLAELARRTRVLTPISERDSSEDPRLQQQRENISDSPQVQGWLQSIQQSTAPAEPEKICSGKCTASKTKSNGKNKVEKADLSIQLKAQDFICQNCGGKKNVVLAAVLPPEQPRTVLLEVDQPVLVEVSQVSQPAEAAVEPQVRILKRSPPAERRMSANVQGSVPSNQPLDQRISGDIQVQAQLESINAHDLQEQAQIQVPEARPAQVHSVQADKQVDVPAAVDHEPTINVDNKLTGDATPLRAHNLESDQAVVKAEEAEPEKESPVHSLIPEPQVPVNVTAMTPYNVESDSRVPTPTPKAQGRRLPRDNRVPTPTGRAFEHGIHFDERVPTPELMAVNIGHSLIQDRKVLSPSPQFEDHDIHADGRVKSPVLLPPREHDIDSDSRVNGRENNELKEHGIQVDDRVPSPAPSKIKDHPLISDIKVAQRAHQLLEHFLEQDRKAARASGRSGRG